MIGRETVKIIVRCPKCSFEYKTIVARTSTCKRCGSSFTVFPKKGRGRMIGIAEGTYQDFLKAYWTYVSPKEKRR